MASVAKTIAASASNGSASRCRPAATAVNAALAAASATSQPCRADQP